jgi:hypothetical protein
MENLMMDFYDHPDFQPEAMDVGALPRKYRGRLAFFGGL